MTIKTPKPKLTPLNEALKKLNKLVNLKALFKGVGDVGNARNAVHGRRRLSPAIVQQYMTAMADLKAVMHEVENEILNSRADEEPKVEKSIIRKED